MKVVIGMQMATASTCRIQRGSQRGSRRGHCSNRPNTSIAVNPIATTRTTADHQPDCQWMPMSAPMAKEKSSVKCSRAGQANTAEHDGRIVQGHSRRPPSRRTPATNDESG